MWFVKGDQGSKKIVFMDNPRASVASENGQTLISFRPEAPDFFFDQLRFICFFS